ncbi:Dimethylsulfoniopropionate utilization transcriptional regulator [Caballeronia sordidicola]|uniref:Dimethylsulfoniopropionate utilization transcriptional regulator n=2 Tax=Caballeronia sordidicola TaxID=196367 RepID=A0A226X4X9_CABSO|nr:Dimethylsulfoniopropionate utilization transcriptional regulator [Caballeronia sordidicola]
MLASGQLIAPFKARFPTSEAFYLVYSPHSTVNPDAVSFAAWLIEEARAARSHD